MADKKKPAEGDAPKSKKAAKAAKEQEVPAAEPVAAPAPTPQTKSTKIPKLAPKNKSRLPRRQKKALQKAARGK
jgi:hypothetical protein